MFVCWLGFYSVSVQPYSLRYSSVLFDFWVILFFPTMFSLAAAFCCCYKLKSVIFHFFRIMWRFLEMKIIFHESPKKKLTKNPPWPPWLSGRLQTPGKGSGQGEGRWWVGEEHQTAGVRLSIENNLWLYIVNSFLWNKCCKHNYICWIKITLKFGVRKWVVMIT